MKPMPRRCRARPCKNTLQRLKRARRSTIYSLRLSTLCYNIKSHNFPTAAQCQTKNNTRPIPNAKASGMRITSGLRACSGLQARGHHAHGRVRHGGGSGLAAVMGPAKRVWSERASGAVEEECGRRWRRTRDLLEGGRSTTRCS